jgi:hypothetical protein
MDPTSSAGRKLLINTPLRRTPAAQLPSMMPVTRILFDKNPQENDKSGPVFPRQKCLCKWLSGGLQGVCMRMVSLCLRSNLPFQPVF